ncbi:MAG: helix-turn-helix domain-containing protein [Anaerolineae bacterium]|jgi:DNA-binding transcriptional regulator YdaS (Cro superfamily)
MTLIELMRELQGEDSQEAFAARIGVHQTMVSQIYNGAVRPGRRVVTGLARAYPERAEEIKACFFALE